MCWVIHKTGDKIPLQIPHIQSLAEGFLSFAVKRLLARVLCFGNGGERLGSSEKRREATALGTVTWLGQFMLPLPRGKDTGNLHWRWGCLNSYPFSWFFLETGAGQGAHCAFYKPYGILKLTALISFKLWQLFKFSAAPHPDISMYDWLLTVPIRRAWSPGRWSSAHRVFPKH